MKTKANVRIRRAMLAAERAVYSRCLAENKAGELWRPFLLGRTWSNALERLEQKGRVRYRKRKWIGGWQVKGFEGRCR